MRELETRYGDEVQFPNSNAGGAAMDGSGQRIAAQFRYWDFYGAENRPVVERYGVRGHPTTVFVNSDGSVATRIPGLVRPSQYIRAIESLR